MVSQWEDFCAVTSFEAHDPSIVQVQSIASAYGCSHEGT